MMKRIAVVSFCLLVAFQICNAKAPIKFGKVSIEDLKMTVYEPDTSAAAVVLCKYGYFNGNDYTFRTVKRVKILKKSGVSLSEFTFPGPENMNVRGRVFNLVNGEVVEEKLKKESVFKVRITEDWYNVRVALPNIKVGSVYDIETVQSWLPPEFAFQEQIPVKYGEVVLEETMAVDFRKRTRGFEPIFNDGTTRFYVKEMPAFKAESFMDSKENYLTKFEFDILNINIPGVLYREFTTSWEAVNDRLAAHTYFGKVLNSGGGFLNSIKKEIQEKYSDPYDKMEAAYEAIKKIKWNEHESVYSSEEHLGGPFKDKEGNSADVNMMLYLLLHKLDINSWPMVMSTRENGQLHRFYPSLDKLNYMFVWAKVDGKEYLLDATDELLPIGLLPERCLNQFGRLVNNESGRWIDLKTEKKDRQTFVYDLVIGDDLEVEGTLQCAKYDYAAYHFRSKYKDFASDEEFLQHLESNNSGLRVKDFELTDVDSIKKPIKEKYSIKISNLAQQVGDMVMINPFVFQKLDDNPFKLEERKYPVDFAYKKERLIMTKITIPSGYSVAELPKPSKIALPEKGGTALITYNALGNVVSLTYKLKINKAVFTPQEYGYLKQLYGLLIEKHAAPIVIKRNENEASL
ncbi:hypothetical protein E9993_22395 [Labilibacter sediminis]|nr:hypothetical protein E9993_22395 [Labilibacter sediminis]